MKKLRVTLNNRVYEVLVEILEDDERTHAGAPLTGPAVPSYPVPMAAPAPTAAAPFPVVPAAPRPAAGAAGQGVFAPIVGTVTKILVAPGAQVTQNQPLIILDAMKMDTYIYAPRTGTIAEVCVEAGTAVQVRDPLIRYAPEG